ncbi:hypothetical protein ACI2IV_12375 [Psychrobacter faecalis]
MSTQSSYLAKSTAKLAQRIKSQPILFYPNYRAALSSLPSNGDD